MLSSELKSNNKGLHFFIFSVIHRRNYCSYVVTTGSEESGHNIGEVKARRWASDLSGNGNLPIFFFLCMAVLSVSALLLPSLLSIIISKYLNLLVILLSSDSCYTVSANFFQKKKVCFYINFPRPSPTHICGQPFSPAPLKLAARHHLHTATVLTSILIHYGPVFLQYPHISLSS